MSDEEGVPVEEASSSGLSADLLARGPVVQVGQRCPAVKREWRSRFDLRRGGEPDICA